MEDVEVNGEDLKNVEEEVLRKNKEREDKLRSEIESKLRREMDEERRKREEADEIKKLREEKQTMEKMLKEREMQREQEIARLKGQIGTTKAIHTQTTPVEQKFEANRFDDNILKDINNESEKAWLEHKGIPRSHFRIR